MTDIQWWEFYSSEAEHKAALSRNRFFDKKTRLVAQRDAELLYDAARRVRDGMIENERT